MFQDQCTGETHEIECPLFSAGVIEFFLRSLIEYWPCALCGQHRGTSTATWCRDCSAKALAVQQMSTFIALIGQPRPPLPRKLSHSFRVDKRMQRKNMRLAVYVMARFIRESALRGSNA